VVTVDADCSPAQIVSEIRTRLALPEHASEVKRSEAKPR
jgi:hypothetical protein